MNATSRLVGQAASPFTPHNPFDTNMEWPVGLRFMALKKEERLGKTLLASVLLHALLVGLLLLAYVLMDLFGWHIPLFDAAKLKPRDIEFVLVETPPAKPLNPNTRNRAEKASRSGGKKINKLRQAPTMRAASSAPKAAAPAKPTPAVTKAAPRPSQPARRPSPQPAPRPPVPQPVTRPVPPQQQQAPKPTPQKEQAKAPPLPQPPRMPTPNSRSMAPPSPMAPSIPTPAPPAPRNPGRSAISGGGPIGSRIPSVSGSSGGSPGSSGARGSTGPRALPGRLGGSGSGSAGSGSTDQSGSPGGGAGPDGVDALPDIDFGPYIGELQRRIKRNWVPPADNRDKRIVAVFTIRRDGSLVGVRLKQGSGIAVADQAAVQAIQVSSPFRPLPAGFKGDTVDVLFTFDYNVLSGRSI
jgi:TonB family protein